MSEAIALVFWLPAQPTTLVQFLSFRVPNQAFSQVAAWKSFRVFVTSLGNGGFAQQKALQPTWVQPQLAGLLDTLSTPPSNWASQHSFTFLKVYQWFDYKYSCCCEFIYSRVKNWKSGQHASQFEWRTLIFPLLFICVPSCFIRSKANIGWVKIIFYPTPIVISYLIYTQIIWRV